MNEKITRSFNCAFRALEEDSDKYIEGYFAVFDDEYDLGQGMSESISRGAFSKYLAGDIRILCNHDTRLVLGRTKSGTATVRADEHGVYVRCSVNPNDSDATNLYARIQRGDVSQASFGGIVHAESHIIRENGDVHYTLEDIEVFEFSVCTFPAYESTDVEARQKNEKVNFTRWKKRMKERMGKWRH